MTRIEFRTDIADKINYTCRWVRKALTTVPESRIVILTDDKTQLARLDEALWTFSDQDFLPHVESNDPRVPLSPVILTCDDNATLPHHQILVNLSMNVPSCFAQFERVLEIISVDPADTDAGRHRYVHYRKRGYILHHEVKK